MADPTPAGPTLADVVRDGLAARADPDAAPTMQAYMKSAMPFRGVAKPARELLLREVVAAHPVDDAATLLAEARSLWSGARYREERYMALALLAHRRHRGWAEPGWVPDLFEGWIVEGGWWDFTDEIASHHVGPLVAAHGLAPLMREWSVRPDRWLRRTSVICQLAAKDRTDLALLTDAIEANLADPDFFLRKGIGWRCGSTPGPTRAGCARSSTPTRGSPRCRDARRSSTCDRVRPGPRAGRWRGRGVGRRPHRARAGSRGRSGRRGPAHGHRTRGRVRAALRRRLARRPTASIRPVRGGAGQVRVHDRRLGTSGRMGHGSRSQAGDQG